MTAYAGMIAAKFGKQRGPPPGYWPWKTTRKRPPLQGCTT